MTYKPTNKDIAEINKRKKELRNTTKKLELAIANLNSTPNLENARLAHETSLRGAYAIYEIVEEYGGVPSETVYNYRRLNLRCLEALERVPVNDGDREHTRYFESLIIRRNDIVSKVNQFIDENDR